MDRYWLRYRRIKDRDNRLSMQGLINSINSNKKGWLIIYSDWCKWSIMAMELLKDKNPVAINLANVKPTFTEILEELKKLGIISINQKTRPLIFFDGEFIGGYDELKNKI
jgi:glutaredoxin